MTNTLETTILKKQNTELAMKIQHYRSRNKQLESKNQELETWVTNFAAIVSALQAAMRVFIQSQEKFYALMSKWDAKDKTFLSAYTQHFKTFNDILTSLPAKLKDSERSNQITQDITTRIDAFVKAYEVFFGKFVEQYFKFNAQNIRWLSEINEKRDLADIFRKLGAKDLEYRNKLESFQKLIDEQRGMFQTLKSHNQSILMGELLRKEQQEVANLQKQNFNLSRRLRLVMDYNQESIDNTVTLDQSYLECICGGAQLPYFKKEWEKKIQKELEIQLSKANQTSNGNGQAPVASSEEVLMLQSEIEELKKNNVSYLQKNEKLKVERKTEEVILRSHAFKDLVGQFQDLFKYTIGLQEKLTQSQQLLADIEKAREKELYEIKKKYQMEKLAVNPLTANLNPHSKILGKDLSEFKADLHKIMSPVRQLLEKSAKTEEAHLAAIKGLQPEALKKQNEELKRRILEMEEYIKTPKVDFKHQAHRKLMEDIVNTLPKDNPKLSQEFINFVKNRQKKANNLQGELKKREKDLQMKTSLNETLTKAYQQTEQLFLQSKQKVEKLMEANRMLQEETAKLAEQNLNLRDESRQDFEWSTHVTVNIGVGRIEPYDQQVLNLLVLEQEQLGECHEGSSFGVLASEETLLQQPLVHQYLKAHSVLD